MKITIDTNVVLDVLGRREHFFDESNAVFQKIISDGISAAVTANAITDIYFLIRKYLSDRVSREAILGLMELVEVINVTKEDCTSALHSPMKDFEDALLDCCSSRWKSDCIITRNKKDFVNATCDIYSPSEFLAKY